MYFLFGNQALIEVLKVIGIEIYVRSILMPLKKGKANTKVKEKDQLLYSIVIVTSSHTPFYRKE